MDEEIMGEESVTQEQPSRKKEKDSIQVKATEEALMDWEDIKNAFPELNAKELIGDVMKTYKKALETQKIRRFTPQLEDLRRSTDRIQQLFENLAATLQDVKDENSREVAEIRAKSDERIAKLRADKDELNDKLKEAKVATAEATKAEREAEAREKEALKAQDAALKSKDTLESGLNLANLTIQELRSEKETLETQMATVRELEAELVKLDDEKAGLSDQLSNLANANENLKNQIADLKTANAELKQSYADEIKQLKVENRAEIKGIKEDHKAELEAVKAEIVQRAEELYQAKLTSEISKALNDANAEIAVLQDRNNTLVANLEESKRRISTLQKAAKSPSPTK